MRFSFTLPTLALTILFAPLLAAAAVAQGPGADAGGVCFFADGNFQGRRYCMNVGQKNPNLNSVGFNDVISSAQIPPGLSATLCEDGNFGGRCITLDRSLANFNDMQFNDVASSITVQAGAARGGPPPERPRVGGPPPPPPGPRFGGPPPPRGPDFADRGRDDDLRRRLFDLRSACEQGDRRACVRFGIIIGENRDKREQWRRDSPDMFWWER